MNANAISAGYAYTIAQVKKVDNTNTVINDIHRATLDFIFKKVKAEAELGKMDCDISVDDLQTLYKSCFRCLGDKAVNTIQFDGLESPFHRVADTLTNVYQYAVLYPTEQGSMYIMWGHKGG